MTTGDGASGRGVPGAVGVVAGLLVAGRQAIVLSDDDVWSAADSIDILFAFAITAIFWGALAVGIRALWRRLTSSDAPPQRSGSELPPPPAPPAPPPLEAQPAAISPPAAIPPPPGPTLRSDPGLAGHDLRAIVEPEGSEPLNSRHTEHSSLLVAAPILLGAITVASLLIPSLWPFAGLAVLTVGVLAAVGSSGTRYLGLALFSTAIAMVSVVGDWALRNYELDRLVDATDSSEDVLQDIWLAERSRIDAAFAAGDYEGRTEQLIADLNDAADRTLRPLIVAIDGIESVHIMPWHRELTDARDAMLDHTRVWRTHLSEWSELHSLGGGPPDAGVEIGATFDIAERYYHDAMTPLAFPWLEDEIVDIFDE